jgi:hypothetical protein
MRFVVPAALLLLALVHALPAIGVLGGRWLETLYGVNAEGGNLQLLLRHRALLFAMLAAFLAYAAFVPALHRLALIAGWLSVGSFLLLAAGTDGLNAALSRVVRVDLLLVVALAFASWAHLRAPRG